MTRNKSCRNKSICPLPTFCGHLRTQRFAKRGAHSSPIEIADLDLFHFASSSSAARPGDAHRPIPHSSSPFPRSAQKLTDGTGTAFISTHSRARQSMAYWAIKRQGQCHFVCDTLNYHLNYDNPQFNILNRSPRAGGTDPGPERRTVAITIMSNDN